MNQNRSDQRASVRALALTSLEDWARVLFDQVRDILHELGGPGLDGVAVFYATTVLDDGVEDREELNRVVLASQSARTELSPSTGGSAWSELVACWDDLRSAFGAMYCEPVPPGLVLGLTNYTFLAYEPTHCDHCGSGPVLAGELDAHTDERDPFADLLTDFEADSELMVSQLEERLRSQLIALPTQLVEDH